MDKRIEGKSYMKLSNIKAFIKHCKKHTKISSERINKDIGNGNFWGKNNISIDISVISKRPLIDYLYILSHEMGHFLNYRKRKLRPHMVEERMAWDNAKDLLVKYDLYDDKYFTIHRRCSLRFHWKKNLYKNFFSFGNTQAGFTLVFFALYCRNFVPILLFGAWILLEIMHELWGKLVCIEYRKEFIREEKS